VILYGERGIEGIAAANDRGLFVSVTAPTEESQQRQTAQATSEEDEEEEGGVRLYESLYETALKHDLPRQTVEDLVRIFAYDVDFQRRVAPGDSFEVFYGADEEGGNDRVEILYAALNIGGEPRRVYRFQSEEGTVDYFDELGRSLKKFLIRKPIAGGQLRSGFGMRRHPILGYSKMHTGVDWADRHGTPIIAAGNGTVIKAEWDSGYGRRIEVQHTNGYVTAYNHQSAFARGIAPGVRVRQGQVIGYVGSSGLSTGPHLHYEVIVNGRFVDPMKIRVPRGRELDGRALAEFKRQREQVDALLQRAGATNRFAQQTR
jgi:murein DD-endopeptidase MepM/ murein hydrolase activator NlpD